MGGPSKGLTIAIYRVLEGFMGGPGPLPVSAPLASRDNPSARREGGGITTKPQSSPLPPPTLSPLQTSAQAHPPATPICKPRVPSVQAKTWPSLESPRHVLKASWAQVPLPCCCRGTSQGQGPWLLLGTPPGQQPSQASLPITEGGEWHSPHGAAPGLTGPLPPCPAQHPNWGSDPYVASGELDRTPGQGSPCCLPSF